MTSRRLFALALPNLISTGSLTLLSVVNAAWVGQLGTAELGAIGMGTTFLYVVVAFPIGLLGAVRTPVSTRFGAGDLSGASRFTWQGIWLALAFGLAALPFAAVGPALFRSMGTSAELAAAAAAYSALRILGAPMHFLVVALGAGFQGRGNSRAVMVANVSANLVNLVLDPILVFGAGPVPALGMAGAALGLDCGLLVALALLAWQSRSLWSADRRPEVALLREVWRIGGPAAFQFLLDVASFIGFQAMLAAGGDLVLAANVVVARIVMGTFLPAVALSDAVAVLVGQSRGARRPKDAVRAVQLGLQGAVGFSVVAGALFVLVPSLLLAPFGVDAAVEALARPVLLLWAGAQILDAMAAVSLGALNGAGDTRYTFAVSTLGAWLVKLPVAAALVFWADGGVLGAWSGIAAESAFQLAMAGWRLRNVGWLVRDRHQAARSVALAA